MHLLGLFEAPSWWRPLCCGTLWPKSGHDPIIY